MPETSGGAGTGLPGLQTPAPQTSPAVQAFPSLHAAPSAFAGFEHTPVPVSQVPASWHWSLAAQTTGFDPAQAPLWQVSVCVQRFPSPQAAPSAFAGFEQTPVPGLHVPTSWHWSLAAQTTGFEPAHAPAWHVSVCVQALPSLHAEPLAFAGFEHTPVPVLHVPTLWH